jgi:hypothetical protein
MKESAYRAFSLGGRNPRGILWPQALWCKMLADFVRFVSARTEVVANPLGLGRNYLALTGFMIRELLGLSFGTRSSINWNQIYQLTGTRSRKTERC